MKIESKLMALDDLVIRSLQTSDIESFREILQTPAMQVLVDAAGCERYQVLLDYYARCVDYPKIENWVILKSDGGKMICVGDVEFYPTQARFAHQEIEGNTLSIGVWISPAFQKQGIGAKALSFLMQHQFEDKPQFDWLLARCAQNNEASNRLLRRSGLHFFKTRPFLDRLDHWYVKNRNPNYDYSRLSPLRPGPEAPSVAPSEPARK